MIRSSMTIKQYDPVNDSVLQEDLGSAVLEATPVIVLDELYHAREDRHQLIHGLAGMIRNLTDSARRELYNELGVHPL